MTRILSMSRLQLWGMAVVLLLAVAISPAHATIAVGDTLPSVRRLNWDGQSVNFADLHGKVVVIDFWASWCAVCRQALPALDTMSRRFQGAPVVVVGVNIDKTRAPAIERVVAHYLPTVRAVE